MNLFGLFFSILPAYGASHNHFNITRKIFEELENGFLYFDRDNNGIVSISELAVGIISVDETPEPVYRLHAFGWNQCADPILDALSFSECLVARARARGNSSANEEVNFTEALRWYIEGCSMATVDWLTGLCLGSCQECAEKIFEHDLHDLKKIDNNPINRVGTTILISSDWHVEPWYMTGASKCGRVCRYKDASLANMFKCKDVYKKTTDCKLNGKSDPPIMFEESHIMSSIAAKATVHFYLGDTQAHDWSNGNGPSTQDSPAAISRLLNRVLTEEVKRFSSPHNIVWTAGNNDGKHNIIFRQQDSWSIAWGKQLLLHQIVTDDLGIMYGSKNQTTVFMESGFYAKSLPGIAPAAYAIVINTNLGGGNQITMSTVKTTLRWIFERHGQSSIVYVFGHHPSVMKNGVRSVYIPEEYRGIIKGVFAGHVHVGLSTTTDLLTIVPAVSQAATDTAFYLATVSESSPEIILKKKNMIRYCGRSEKVASPTKWCATRKKLVI